MRRLFLVMMLWVGMSSAMEDTHNIVRFYCENSEQKKYLFMGVLHSVIVKKDPSLLKSAMNLNIIHIHDKIDHVGNTPLHYAAMNGSHLFIKTLLDYFSVADYCRGLSIKNNRGETPADMAYFHTHIWIAKMLKSPEALPDFDDWMENFK